MAKKDNSPVVDSERLRRLFDGVNGFGQLGEGGGFDRRAFSDADLEARRWFAAQMEEAGLSVRWDGAGNVCGRFGEGDGPAVMAGSHLDTAAAGGAFGGTLGACVALESVRALQDAGVNPSCPIEVVATSDAEGRFGGTLGTLAITGQASEDWIARAVDGDGVTLCDAMTEQHLHPAAIGDAARDPGSVKSFLELYVEQGPVLEAAGEAAGVVEAVSGLCEWRITLDGTANHAGTTPMDRRADAFAGLAEVAATIPAIIRIVGGEDTRVTVGKVDIHPNEPHTVPGRAAFSLDIRDTDERAMRAITAALRALVDRVAGARGLAASIQERTWLPPAGLDPELAAIVEEEAAGLGLGCRRMTSGAGRDARTMQAFCPAALILVPSRDGVGHAPEEQTEWAAVEKGAALYLRTLLRLCDLPARETPGEPVAVAATAAAPAGLAAETGEEGAVSQPDDATSRKAAKADEASGEGDIDFDFDLDDIAVGEDD